MEVPLETKNRATTLPSTPTPGHLLRESVVSQSAVCNPTDYSPPGSSTMDFPGKNIGVGCHFLLQGIFPTQGLNEPGSPILQTDSLPSEPPVKPNKN